MPPEARWRGFSARCRPNTAFFRLATKSWSARVAPARGRADLPKDSLNPLNQFTTPGSRAVHRMRDPADPIYDRHKGQ